MTAADSQGDPAVTVHLIWPASIQDRICLFAPRLAGVSTAAHRHTRPRSGTVRAPVYEKRCRGGPDRSGRWVDDLQRPVGGAGDEHSPAAGVDRDRVGLADG